MSDRDEFEKWYQDKFKRASIESGYETYLTWQAWQAAQAQAVNQQAIDIIQDCIAMGYLVETVDSSPTHRGLVKRAHKVIESSGETPQSVIAVQQAAAAVNQQLPAARVWNQAEGRDGKLYAHGWNDCLAAIAAAQEQK